MGRGRGKKRSRGGGDRSSAPSAPRERDASWRTSPLVLESDKFNAYYRKQGILPDGEWEEFLAAAKAPLPSTFRITPGPLAKRLKHRLLTELVPQMQQLAEAQKEDASLPAFEAQKRPELPLVPPHPLPWYPDDMAWTFSASRVALRKIPLLKEFHHWVVSENERGSLTRQEAVSMLPPLLLDVEPSHAVLDLCASPGSKTGQIIQALLRDGPDPAGFVVANDIDSKRCYLLFHQVKRERGACALVTNHEAQNFPNLFALDDAAAGGRRRIEYDRVLADVPCSGDGTMRKNLDIWRKWNDGNGRGLHRLQYAIALRGVEALKTGGRMVYSTCSLNPLENEAVVAAVLRRCGGAVRLVDVSSRLPQFQRRPGMATWHVPGGEDGWLASYADVPQNLRSKIFQTMFPPADEAEAAAMHLEHCLRVYPHVESTGGFFVAVLEKTQQWTRGTKLAAASPVADAKEAGNAATMDEPAPQQTNDVDDPADTAADTAAAVSAEGTDNLVEEASKEEENGRREFADLRRQTRQQSSEEDAFHELGEVETPLQEQFFGFFGLDQMPKQQMFRRGSGGRKGSQLYWVSRGLAAVARDIIRNNQRVKVINMGLKIAIPDAERYRLSQETAHIAALYMQQRIVRLPRHDLVALLSHTNPLLHLFSEPTRAAIEALSRGCILFIYRDDDEDVVLSAYKGKVSVRLFLVDAEIVSYQSCFLTPEERAAVVKELPVDQRRAQKAAKRAESDTAPVAAEAPAAQ